MSRIRPRFDKRKLNKLRDGLEWPRVTNYYNNEMMPILDYLKRKSSDARLKGSLRKYLIIKNVSVIEDFFSNLARRIIDENNLNVSGLIPKEAKPLIDGGKLTKGKVIAMSYYYANLSQIDFVFSKSLKISFLDYIRGVSKDDPYRYIKGAVLLHKNWKNFEKMFDNRNAIVHALKDVKLSDRPFLSLCENTINFIDIASALRIPSEQREAAEKYRLSSS